MSGDDNVVSCLDEMSCVPHAVSAYKYLLSVDKHAVQAGRYAMSGPGHVLSDICDKMSKRRNLFAGRLYAMSNHRHVVSAGTYAMWSGPGHAVSTAEDAVSACIYARSGYEYLLSADKYAMPGRPDILSDQWYAVSNVRNTMSALSNELSDPIHAMSEWSDL